MMPLNTRDTIESYVFGNSIFRLGEFSAPAVCRVGFLRLQNEEMVVVLTTESLSHSGTIVIVFE